jgi:hypothetical protein
VSERTEGVGGAAPGQARHARIEKAKEVAADEFRRYLIAFVYILVLLGMFTMHQEITLRAHGGESKALPFAPHGFAIVNALVLAKVALVVEALRLGHRVRPEPLIWPILLESLILAVMFVAMHYVEHIVGGWIHGEALAKSVPMIGGGGAVGVFFATFSFFVAMIPFVGFRLITLAVGWPRMRGILFGGKGDGARG